MGTMKGRASSSGRMEAWRRCAVLHVPGRFVTLLFALRDSPAAGANFRP